MDKVSLYKRFRKELIMPAWYALYIVRDIFACNQQNNKIEVMGKWVSIEY